jgi:hypothetical protein
MRLHPEVVFFLSITGEIPYICYGCRVFDEDRKQGLFPDLLSFSRAMKRLLLIFLTICCGLALTTKSFSQSDNTLVIPDIKAENEGFFHLHDTLLAGEIASFNVVGRIYGRKPSEPLQVYSLGSLDPYTVEFWHDDNLVIIEAGRFHPGMHRLEFYRRSGFLYKIDGRFYWGNDGKIPDKRVTNIRVVINGRQVPIPRAAFSDIFEPNLCGRRTLFGRIQCGVAVYESQCGERVYVYMRNGTIPTLYEVTWIFREGRYVGRVVDYAY